LFSYLRGKAYVRYLPHETTVLVLYKGVVINAW
jgi:hypothetical protein